MIIGIKDDQSTKKILYLSYCYVGKTHDYTMLKEEFPPKDNRFEKFKIRVDLGYLGFDKDYTCKEVYLPKKSSKKQSLTEDQKLSKRELASQRIDVEHSIGSMKRYRILSDRLRINDFDTYDNILEVCAGLSNFYISN